MAKTVKKSAKKGKPAKAKKAAKSAKASKANGAKSKTVKAKKPPAKAKAKTKRKPNAAFMRPMQPSEELAAVVGNAPLPRSEVVSKVWAYIRKNKLQNPENRREILADATLQPLFGKRNVSMFEMNKHLSKHMS